MVPLQTLGRLFVLIIIASSIRQGYGFLEEIGKIFGGMNAQEINEYIFFFFFVHLSIVKTEILLYNVTKITTFCFKK